MGVFGDSILYVNLEECTSCTACYQPDVCPVGAIYSEEHLPDGSPTSAKYNAEDPNKGHDHTFFVQNSRDVFADSERLNVDGSGPLLDMVPSASLGAGVV